MTPVLFEIPLPGGSALPLPAYGSLLALGFVLAAIVAGERAGEIGLGRRELFDVGFVAVVAGLFGAHLLHLALRPWTPGAGPSLSPLAVLAPWGGGLAYYGGLAGGAAALLVVARLRSLAVLPLLDLVAPVSALALGVTRVGCFLNGCCFGRPTDLPWAVAYPPGSAAWSQHASLGLVSGHEPSLPLHPTQLYEAGVALLLFALLWPLHRRPHPPGRVVFSFLAAYAAWRSASQFLRADQGADPVAAWTRPDPQQWISLAVLTAAVAGLAWCRRRRSAGGSVTPAPGDQQP